MKTITVILLGLLFCSNLIFVPKKTLKIDLLIGDYYDDHTRRVFNFHERKWNIEDNKLKYKIIDRRNYHYADTLSLSQNQLDTIVQIIENQNIMRNIVIDYNSTSTKHMRYKKEVKGIVQFQNKKYNYDIKSNSTAIENEINYINIKKLEDYFYKLTEQK